MNLNKVTATVSTRGRYFSTLPLCISAIATQNRKPDELIIYDDNDPDKRIDLREEPIYINLFQLLSVHGIDWKVNFGQCKGQVKNHQQALIDAKHELIWRLDDDNIPAPEVLETLLNNFKENTGAIGGLILDPKSNISHNLLASNKIEDIFLGLNEQWFVPKEMHDYKIVDHLYSSFLFRKCAAFHGYEQQLSKIGHREETIFTYEMKLKGWDIAINTNCVTWHFNNPDGGIRDNFKNDLALQDEDIFKAKLKDWNINPKEYSFIVLNSGLGDHLVFKSIIDKIKAKYKNLVLATCYPDVFKDDPDIIQISIANAISIFGEDLSRWSIYGFMADNNWKESIVKAYEALYL
jgi:glycosyltransferase involved in cell wall biosynthesis